MRGRNFRLSMEFNGHRVDESVLTFLSGGRTEYWSIDVPTVLWMLERIAEGDVDANTVRNQLHQATLWDSGCCAECDRASADYDDARTRYEAAVQRWKDQQAQFDAAEYPYILNKGKIHTRDCHHPSKPTPPRFPESLHEFAVLFDGYGENLDRVFEELDQRSSRGAQRLSVREVQTRIARDGVRAVKARLCRTCKPSLPELDPEATMLQPACWAWPADRTVVEHLRTEAVLTPRSDVLPEQRVDFAMLEQWHNGRCAICGEDPAQGGLVRDHDHVSGTIRGLLCQSCNITEARSTSMLFVNYRRRPPSAILAIEVLYLPSGFQPGTGHLPTATRGAAT